MARTVGVVFGLSILFTIIGEFRRNRLVLFAPFHLSLPLSPPEGIAD